VVECPDANVVQAFVAGKLDRAAHDDLVAHVDRCTACRRLVAGLAPEPTRTDATVPSPGAAIRDRASPGRIERYKIGERIGEGGMGVVYAAYDPELHRDVALKLIRGAESDSNAEHARLLREAQAMARVSHPNVIAVYDAGTSDSQVYVAMELAAKGTLRAWQGNAKRTWREILDAYLQAGRGLAAAHAAGVVHRDFKPDNVLIGGDGRIRVTDFGLAHAEVTHPDASAAASGMLGVSLTLTGVMVGTPAYMSPEQIDGGVTDARSDQFAFCVACWEALYRAPPFPRGDLADVREAMNRAIVAPARTLGAPSRVRVALTRGLSVDPQRRWPTMEALLRALAPRRSRVVFIAAPALVACALGVTLLAATRTREDPCADAGGHTAWNDAAHARARSVLGDRYEAVAKVFDARVAEYRQQRTDACRATRVDHRRSEQDLARATLCVDDRLAMLDREIADLDKPGPEGVKTGASLARSLDALASCDRPVDLTAEAHGRDVLNAAGQAMMDWYAGKGERALAAMDDAVGRGRALGDPKVLAEVLIGRAQMRRAVQHFTDANRDLEEAIQLAESAGDDRQRAQALALLHDNASILHEPDPYERLAVAAASRPGVDDSTRADGLELQAAAIAKDGKLDDARALWDQALAIRDKLDDVPNHVHNRDALATAYQRAGKLSEARELLNEALTYEEQRTSGAIHDAMVNMTLSSLVGLEIEAADWRAVAAAARRRLAFTDKLRAGGLAPELAGGHEVLGLALAKLDDPEADRELDKALTLARGHPAQEATVCMLMYSADAHRERFASALSRAKRALELAPDSAQPDTTQILQLVGDGELALGRAKDAIVSYEKGIARGHTDPDTISRLQSGLGRALIETGDATRARPLLEDAVRTLDAEAAAKPWRFAGSSGNAWALARARFGLAQALAATGGDTERARGLARDAKAVFATDPRHGGRKHVAEVDAWLAHHASP
jgi:tetratricopeptide (TPR) repeat protein